MYYYSETTETAGIAIGEGTTATGMTEVEDAMQIDTHPLVAGEGSLTIVDVMQVLMRENASGKERCGRESCTAHAVDTSKAVG